MLTRAPCCPVGNQDLIYSSGWPTKTANEEAAAVVEVPANQRTISFDLVENIQNLEFQVAVESADSDWLDLEVEPMALELDDDWKKYFHELESWVQSTLMEDEMVENDWPAEVQSGSRSCLIDDEAVEVHWEEAANEEIAHGCDLHDIFGSDYGSDIEQM